MAETWNGYLLSSNDFTHEGTGLRLAIAQKLV